MSCRYICHCSMPVMESVPKGITKYKVLYHLPTRMYLAAWAHLSTTAHGMLDIVAQTCSMCGFANYDKIEVIGPLLDRSHDPHKYRALSSLMLQKGGIKQCRKEDRALSLEFLRLLHL